MNAASQQSSADRVAAAPGTCVVMHGEREVGRCDDLYEAAGVSLAHLGTLYVARVPADLIVIDNETGEHWSHVELFDGGYMDDYLPLEAVQARHGVFRKNPNDDAPHPWMQSKLVKKQFRAAPPYVSESKR